MESSETPPDTIHPLTDLPEGPVHRWMRPLARFIQIETAGGGVLLLCAVVALLVANSGASSLYHAVWEFPIEIRVGGLALSHSLAEWVNDGLMTIFFFVVGLEIKREILFGELRDPRKAALPIAAAAGGLAGPAAIYLSLQWGEPGARGWGIPMATDIAFTVGCLALLGPRVPHGLKIFVLALAIVDDIGGILVIAFGYSEGI